MTILGVPVVMAGAVAAFLVNRPLTSPTPASVLTGRDRVILSPVVNRTGDAIFDDTLTEALGLQLRQSPFLKVVPEPEVQALLRLMGQDPRAPVTAEIARELCRRAGAGARLGGSIAAAGTGYLVRLEAQPCASDDALAEAEASAAAKEDVITALGGAVASFRARLGEPPATIQRYGAAIEAATTASLEALKAFSQGVRAGKTAGDFDAVPFFRRAIALDPEFALAYARLGVVYAGLRQGDEARTMMARAFELRQKVSEPERLYIEARYLHRRGARRATGDRGLPAVARDVPRRLHRASQCRRSAQATR